ncbi:hypothetical protein J2X69_005000 [Algoriphagus sp. 4150]|uniref:DUF4221 family protein n=1 Tax=Algoriphagus sp. 4150 TaxID=2817756 RepID=UPI002864E781|nr:DUF4221 family protein [Algoriphagus sp. 4150]MDR7132626.1 hypothetical protein [Algoriphagus sp. 4150]
MKKLFPLFLLGICLSCGKPTDEAQKKKIDFSYSIDTVMVDAGDELVYLQTALSHSSISNNQKKLFNFSPKSELEVIDLDNLELLHKITTEKEGVLGTGWPYAIQFDQTEDLVFYGFNEVRIFNSDLNSMHRYSLTEEALSGLAPDMLSPFNPKITNGKILYSIYENLEQVPQGLAIVSLEDTSVKKIPLELAEQIEPYTYSLFVQGRLSNKGHEPIHLILVENQLIISTAYAHEAIALNLESETATKMTFHSELAQDKTAIPTRTSAETINEFEDLLREAEKSVRFGPFYFDKNQSRFYRFSRELDREIGDSLIFRNVLTVFDKELNQIVEAEILADPFSKKFFKDGKLWSYVNVEDELGFAVFTFDF